MIQFIQFFTIQRQIILFIASLLLTAAFHIAWGWGGFAGSWIPITIIIILLVKHLLVGTVNAAAMKLQFQDMDGAEKILKYTWKPSWLRFGYHGMYYFILSTIAFQRKEMKEAEKQAKVALELELQDDFTAMLYLQLMHIAGKKQNRPKVKEYLQKAKKLNVTRPELIENIKEIDAMMKGKVTQAQKKMMKGKRGQHTMMNQGYMKRGRRK